MTNKEQKTLIHNWKNPLSLPITLILVILTLLNPILSLSSNAKTSFNNYDPAKIKYAKDRPKTQEPGQSKLNSSNGEDQEDLDTQEEPPETPPNKLTIQSTGCYYISRISNDGAGGKLYLVAGNPDGSDKLISDNYNNLTTKSDSILLGNFLSGQDLILKITPFYSQSPKTILSTDSSRVKQVNLGNNSFSLSFEDWLDYDFNDIVLKVEKGICEGEGEPEPPSNPEPPVTPTPITEEEKQKRLEEWKRPEPQNSVRPTIPTPTLPQVPTVTPVINTPTIQGESRFSPTMPIASSTPISKPNASGGQGVSATLAPTTSATLPTQKTTATSSPTTSPTTTATPLGPELTLSQAQLAPATITGTPLYNECNYPALPYDNWCAQYYNNNPYSGIMSYSENYYPSRDSLGRTDYINKDWGYGNPGGITPSDYFSAKFSKKQWFDSGHYKFYTGYDDGMKLVINGNLILDKWENPAADTDTRIDLPTGWHIMEVYYQEKTGSAKLSLSWELACKTNNNFSDWCVEFYPNKFQTGIPVKPVTRAGDFWDDNWGNNNPTVNLTKGGINSFSGTYLNSPSGISSLPADNFSGYFTKMHYFPASTYTFISKADDGTEIILDGTRIINQSGCCSETRTDRYLTEGWYLLQVKFREDGGQAAFALRWEYTDKTPPAGYITNPPPGVNYMGVVGNSFTVTANPYDQGAIQSGIASVDFFAYYDNSLKYLGTSYNTGGIPLYSANLDLTKLSKYNTGSQDIELSITVKDKAGNITTVAGGSRWITYSYSNIIEQNFTVNDGYNNYTSANLRIENPNITGNSANLKASYSTSGQNRNVWIVSHGMNNSRDNMTDLASAIIQNTKEVNGTEDIVLTLDWSQGANSGLANPTDTDKWIEPTAIQIKKKLTDWGFTNKDKLFLMGHSMGTIMSAEISSQFGNQAKLLIALDPPRSTAPIGQFTTNDVTGRIFNSFASRAQRTVAYVGRGYLSGSICGSYAFTTTANEAYQVYLPEQNDTTAVCPAHGSVVKSITSMYRDRRIQNGLLAINNTAAGTFTRTRLIDDVYPIDVNGMIYATQDSNIQYLAYLQNNRINLVGKTPRVSELTEYWLKGFPIYITNIPNFSADSERIGLITSGPNSINYRYQIVSKNNKPVIQLSKKDTYDQNFSAFTDFAEIDGGRADVSKLQSDLVLLNSGLLQKTFISK